MMNREQKPSDPDERKRIEKAGGRVEPFKNMMGEFIGPPRVWKKFEQAPGLMMSRSFGDAYGHSCGVISTPENRTFNLDKTIRALVMGSDGLWEVTDNKQIAQIVQKYAKTQDGVTAAKQLYEAALMNWKRRVCSIFLTFLEPSLCR